MVISNNVLYVAYYTLEREWFIILWSRYTIVSRSHRYIMMYVGIHLCRYNNKVDVCFFNPLTFLSVQFVFIKLSIIKPLLCVYYFVL